MKPLYLSLMVLCLSCGTPDLRSTNNYFATTEAGVKTGGVKMIPITTPSGTFNVWTKRFGNNPSIKVLLLHGGPGGTHEQLECFESFFPQEGIEFYEYDQLGSYYSDQPSDTTLWDIDRMVDEVEQVRRALGLGKDNFFLLGHSWGGLLAMQYALKNQEHLKGLIVCNMFSRAANQNAFSQKIVDGIDQEAAKELRALDSKKDFDNPRYMELMVNHIYKYRGLRAEILPEPVARSFKHFNSEPDRTICGRGSLMVSGKLANLDIFEALSTINTPTLMVTGNHDFVDPRHMEEMSLKVKRGQFLFCSEGSHNALWDDQEFFMRGVIKFIKEVE